MTKPRTPKAWTPNALKSHLGSSFQSFHRMRAEMLTAATDGKSIGPAIVDIGNQLRAEHEWLMSLQPVPDHLRTAQRTVYLSNFADGVMRCATSLTEASNATNDNDKWEAFGVMLLSLLAYEPKMPQIDRR